MPDLTSLSCVSFWVFFVLAWGLIKTKAEFSNSASQVPSEACTLLCSMKRPAVAIKRKKSVARDAMVIAFFSSKTGLDNEKDLDSKKDVALLPKKAQLIMTV
jgi:hypothetical protein